MYFAKIIMILASIMIDISLLIIINALEVPLLDAFIIIVMSYATIAAHTLVIKEVLERD